MSKVDQNAHQSNVRQSSISGRHSRSQNNTWDYEFSTDRIVARKDVYVPYDLAVEGAFSVGSGEEITKITISTNDPSSTQAGELWLKREA
jgi:hypothetical protein